MENVGICFNHESPRRGENLVTRKIPLSLANIISGKQNTLRMAISTLYAIRDTLKTMSKECGLPCNITLQKIIFLPPVNNMM